MANLDQIADFVADKTILPFTYVDTIRYTQLNSGWTATYNGFMVFTIEPSDSNNGYAYIKDNTDDISDVCKVYGAGGVPNSVMAPIIKGHEYILRSKSSNVQADGRCYGRYYKIF